ncbi:ornithine cyclodeaminase [Thioclava sp. ES.031]|uniref:ornithine cyclodeaminase family protein n=1 Tax=Thioclava sp. ES.031 TaxID=1798203 RepID=UPI000BF68582|nr:ornithine cyclodeaminase [Thioclava sp. ES.031]PFG62773.1 ornithine cyclodeaminase [Thioclava sp. ES.031]
MSPKIIPYDIAEKLDWPGAIAALRAGHTRPKAELGDTFLGPSDAVLLSRAAYIPGLGYGVKSFTVCDGNAQAGLPTVQGAMVVFEPEHGQPTAIVDCPLVTEFKTAADSVLGAQLLARPDSGRLLIVGGGRVARSLIAAYAAGFPGLTEITLWTRRPEQAQELAAGPAPEGLSLRAVTDLAEAVAEADIVSCATMARAPVLQGAWVKPGTHVDLIGAYKADMREADDALISTASLFVDSRDTTLGHIGELLIPIREGVITPEEVKADLYDLIGGARGRESAEEITLYKNGGGAHLDLMIADWISRAG